MAVGGAEAATTTAAEVRRPPLVVIGHRGKGMNALASADPRLRGDVRENTLRAFNDAAASHPAVAYVEFDGQVNKIMGIRPNGSPSFLQYLPPKSISLVQITA